MQHSEKVEFKPKKSNKMINMIKIILGLAKINAYDDEGRIRNSKNRFLPNSNVIDLIENAMSHNKVLVGENEFINLLIESKIDPDLIANNNIKAKVIERSSDSPPHLSPEWEIPDDE